MPFFNPSTCSRLVHYYSVTFEIIHAKLCQIMIWLYKIARNQNQYNDIGNSTNDPITFFATPSAAKRDA